MDADDDEVEQPQQQEPETQPMDLPEQAPAEPPEESEATEDVQEPEQEDMDLPEQAPDEEVPAVDQAEDSTTEDSAAAMEVPEREEVPEKPDPDWEDSIDDMQRQFGGDNDYDEYQPAEASWQDEMGWQQALADRSNSI
jgi:hypothetical protein